MEIQIPFTVEIEAKASSTYSEGLIDRRLAQLEGMPESDESAREIAFLRELQQRGKE